jgi:hypothetical protein
MSGKASVSKADTVLRQVLDLSPGDVTYRGEMESMRTLLFMARRRLLTKDSGIDSKIRISRYSDDGQFAVKITRMNEMEDSIIVIRKDGTTEKKMLLVTPREAILDRLDDMVRSGMTPATIAEFKDSYFLPTIYPDRVEISKAIDWLAQEQQSGRMVSFVLDKVETVNEKVLPIEEIPPPREEIRLRIAVDLDDG